MPGSGSLPPACRRQGSPAVRHSRGKALGHSPCPTARQAGRISQGDGSRRCWLARATTGCFMPLPCDLKDRPGGTLPASPGGPA